MEQTTNASGERLFSIIKRIEKLSDDKGNIMEDIKDVYREAKGVGFDVKVIKKIVALRKVDVAKRREAAELLDLYMASIGMEE